MYINKSIKIYLDDLAAKRPAPGGGSASALSASIGVSLMSMAVRYTLGNSKYKDCEEKVADILVRCESYRSRLERLVDEDVRAYDRLAAARSESGEDKEKLETLYKEAVVPPFDTCKISAECLRLCKVLAGCGNKNLITDVAIAAILLEGAFFSAKFNVYVNLKSIKDMDYIGGVHGVLAPLERELPLLKEEILEMCEEVID